MEMFGQGEYEHVRVDDDAAVAGRPHMDRKNAYGVRRTGQSRAQNLLGGGSTTPAGVAQEGQEVPEASRGRTMRRGRRHERG